MCDSHCSFLVKFMFGKPIQQEQSGPFPILRLFSKNESGDLNYTPTFVDSKVQFKTKQNPGFKLLR